MEHHHVVVLGGGLSGICMAIKLREAGHKDVLILEKNGSVGGTWYANTYPGCQCDVPSAVYSYSFNNYPEWNAFYPNQPQILEYIHSTVAKFKLSDCIRLEHHVRQCTWSPENRVWELLIETPQTKKLCITATFVITASGPLHVPSYPLAMGVDNRGRSAFRGESMHTARWNSSVDLTGKRVGVIGTGASAIQLIPAIADKVGKLYVFQRTPPWVLYKTDFPIPNIMKFFLRTIPTLMYLLRVLLYWAIESRFMTLVAGSLFNKWLKYDLDNYMKSVIEDDDLRRRLTPDFDPACKRLLFHSSYYATFAKDNVVLISDGISKITEKGILVRRPSGEELIELDVIIYSTGFHIDRSCNEPLPGDKSNPYEYQLDLIGEQSFSSKEWTKQGPRAYLGVSAPQFPNMFFLLGPNTILAHNSVIFMAECQCNYIVKLLKQMNERNCRYVKVKESVMKEYYEWIRMDMANKVWHNCTSWYRAPVAMMGKGEDSKPNDVERKGDILALWPSTTIWYWYRTYFPNLADYETN